MTASSTPTSLSRHPHAAVTSMIGTLLFVASPSTLSSSPRTALAFSHRRVTFIGGAPRALSQLPSSPECLRSARRVGGSGRRSDASPSLAFRSADGGGLAPGGRKRNTSSALSTNPRRYDVDLAADEEAPAEKTSATTKSSTLKEDLRNIATLVGAQALLIPVSILLAKALNVPKRGLGEGFGWTAHAAGQGLQWTITLFAVAGLLRLMEPYFPPLQGVTKATQRSVLAVLGKRRRPVFALLASLLLGAVAGWGEEWLFRGVLQTALCDAFSGTAALAACGLVFGLLHAVTPVYALLAGAASVFFGHVYVVSDNLAVPMICHGAYDVGALLWAHWTVTGLSTEEQDDILSAGPGAPAAEASAKH